MQSNRLLVAAALLCGVTLNAAWADPCGMVPPISINDATPIVRVGDQQTYVFYKDGIETFVIRPGFSGKVDEFGMLIPFPAPPAVRKAPDDIFPHIAAAIDPPEVVVYVNRFFGFGGGGKFALAKSQAAPANNGLALHRDKVRVISEEAVGMYEVAVLEAGSAAALKRWVTEHKYKYPDGMDKVCEEYVALRWCFVAVKTKVGQKAGVDPRPGQVAVDSKLPSGAVFDGHVQAMGFRFPSKKLVVPMRLSAFNEGELHNIVYLLTDGPRRIRSIPEEYVVRQISGEELFRNLTEPLPLRVIGGVLADLHPSQRKNLTKQRDPTPRNGHARVLFAGDLLAVAAGRLSHPHEEDEKMLLRIGEHFGLRGAEADKQNYQALALQREAAIKKAMADLKNMTLTVVDGDFPREVLSGQNLVFAEYRMPRRRNKANYYDARSKKPSGKMQGILYRGALPAATTKKLKTSKTRAERRSALPYRGIVVGLLMAVLFGLVLTRRRRD